MRAESWKIMKLEERKLLNMIAEHNFEGLQNYLNNRQSEELLTPQVVNAAFHEFLISDAKAMTNSQNIIELLHGYISNDKRKAKYHGSRGHIKIVELFELHERALDHKTPRAGSTFSQETAERYNKKMGVFEERKRLYKDLGSSGKAAEFKRSLLVIINAESRRRIGLIDLKEFEKAGRNDYFTYVTGCPEDELSSRLNEIMLTLPDKLFDQPLHKQLDVQLLIAEEVIITQHNLSKDGEFLSFFVEFVEKLLSFIKDAAVMLVMPKQKAEAITDPTKLTSTILLQRLLDTALDDEAQLKIIESDIKLYQNFLIKEGRLLDADLEKLNADGLNKRLSSIKEHIFLSVQVNHYPYPAFQAIQNTSSRYFSSTQLIESQEKTELAMIKLLDGKEGDVVLANGLTKRQEFALKLFAEAGEKKRKLPRAQKLFVQEFIESALGDAKLSTALRALTNENRPSDVQADTISFVATLIELTKKADHFISAADRIMSNNKKIKQGEKVILEDQVTLGEFSMVLNYYAPAIYPTINSILQGLERLIGISPGANKLSNFRRALYFCKPVIEEINQAILQEAKYEAGDVLMSSSKKIAEFYNKEEGVMEKLTKLFTLHGHTVKLNIDKTSKAPLISHVTYEGGSVNPLRINQYLYSDLYNIKVEKLLNPQFLNLLKNHYGDDYVVIINNIYREIEHNLHNKESYKFKNVIVNGMVPQVKAGLADMLLPLGHSKLEPTDFELLHKNIINGVNTKTEMICSEFAARTTAAAFIELNNQLKATLGITDKDKNVVNIPFDARERFRTIHPDRLLSILEFKGCIEKAPRTKTEERYIAAGPKNFVDRVADSERGGQVGR